ncbi:LysM peptidoglycan-binding domain-containing protein [Arthrobacter sp. zg-Y820]|uniref:LysM peptidoglycan-binding domain-containing protein n=1 Tax=unclassified Arthrobacter TaxID=235627 RepID=UPI001E53799A|nr:MULTISPECIES: LysM peptidoglycan-binding domain-containing protein [unclassified Arthrobacter]MCC9198204.1 LysM peptidoglycan-binding domain-containing protein [Arthrobacter sp. zg-Y820]MDK1281073.1 LysM peptidoglycan-binding domain-containing protein [Arthrobacter sp. zg.Y820]MDK1360389.1 LysM peptidoglycan-binding domain-containing protein [Arthrobacter sp. zg-Y1219]WIB10533.1 LysM peptidoglycan-binding domain-containing protein [Arthrobacter sp. zg-Y820]
MPAQIHLSNPISRFISAPARPQLTAARASAPRPVAGSTNPAAVPVPAERRQLRLTRRGRLVFIGLPLMLTAAAALTVLGFFTAPAMASSGGAPDVTQTVQVSVGAGDSLWALAEEFAPDRDPRDVVAEIMELNNLSDDRVPVGVQLFIPTQR